MRVLWFTDVLPREVRRRLGLAPSPGLQAWVDRLTEELAGLPGVQLEIASPAPGAYEPFDAGGVRYLAVPSPPPGPRLRRIADGWRHQLAAPETLAAAAGLLRTTRPDIVHVHGTESAFGTVAVADGRTPCVVSLQGLLQQYQRAYFAGRSPGEVARLVWSGEFVKGRGVLHGYARMRAMARRELEVMRTARWFIGRTDWDRGALAAANPRAVYFHCDEIMRREFYAADWSRREHQGARLYSTSSAMLFKGTETLLEAAAVLRRRGVGGLRLRIAGVPAGSEVDGLYRRTARRYGVSDVVEWLGRLDAPAIVAELEASDVFVYPSHIDNSPNALVEAMLAGVPITASYAGGIPSLVRDGAEGLLVPRGDAVALAAAAHRLLDDRDTAARYGAAARRRARERNDPARIAARTVEIYEKVIAAEAAGTHRPLGVEGADRA